MDNQINPNHARATIEAYLEKKNNRQLEQNRTTMTLPECSAVYGTIARVVYIVAVYVEIDRIVWLVIQPGERIAVEPSINPAYDSQT